MRMTDSPSFRASAIIRASTGGIRVSAIATSTSPLAAPEKRQSRRSRHRRDAACRPAEAPQPVGKQIGQELPAPLSAGQDPSGTHNPARSLLQVAIGNVLGQGGQSGGLLLGQFGHKAPVGKLCKTFTQPLRRLFGGEYLVMERGTEFGKAVKPKLLGKADNAGTMCPGIFGKRGHRGAGPPGPDLLQSHRQGAVRWR